MLVLEETGRLCFEVRSTTRAGEKRFVDMCQFEGNGFCNCWRFANQIRAQLEETIAGWSGEPGAYEPLERHQCEHIRAVNRYLANKLVQRIRLAYPDDQQTT